MALRLKILFVIYSGFGFLIGLLFYAASGVPAIVEMYEEIQVDAYMPQIILGILGTGLFMMLLVDRIIGSRVRKLRESVSNIGTSGDFSARINVEGKDEVSALTTEINGMLLKLEWSHSELKDREAQLRQITDNMMDLISQINVKGVLKYVSPSFKNILGQKPKEMLEKNIFDFMHSGDHRNFVAAMKNALETSTLGLMEFRLRHSSGRYLWFESIGTLLFDEKQNISGVIFGSREITDRKKAEEALKESEEKYKQIVVDIEEGYFEVDLEGKLTFYNNSFCKVTGFTRKELRKADSDVIFNDPVEISTYLQLFDKNDKPQRGIVWTLKKKNSEIVFLDVSLYSMKDKQGNHMGARGLVRDVTENKLKEQEIKRINEELERRVAERTAQLEAANKELESFSYSVSHDLRAPLRSIDGFSTALMVDYGDDLDPQAKDYLERVRSASQRMGQLIDDLLNLSRVMRSEMHIMPINLSELAVEVVEEIRELEPERKLDIEVKQDLQVQGDPRLMKIMLMNLMENAWKFTGKTEDPHVEMSSFQEDSKTVYFVKDNGAGFDMEYSDKLFGPFQRLHSPSEFAGTGVGLATVARIVKRHNGSIWAEGEVGKGATFYFTLNT